MTTKMNLNEAAREFSINEVQTQTIWLVNHAKALEQSLKLSGDDFDSHHMKKARSSAKGIQDQLEKLDKKYGGKLL
jgi:hypothetical protein